MCRPIYIAVWLLVTYKVQGNNYDNVQSCVKT